MTIVQNIDLWFEQDQPYLMGVQLYQVTGGSLPLRYFERYVGAPWIPTAVEQALSQALSNYLEDHPEESPETPTPSHEVKLPIPAHAQHTMSPFASAQSEPAPIKQLRERAKLLLKTRSDLHSQLRIMVEQHEKYSKNDRYEVTLQIENLRKEISAVYEQIDLYESTGDLPLVIAHDIEKQIAEKLKRKKYVSERISRIKGMLKGQLKDKRRQVLNKQLLDLQVEREAMNNE